MARARILIHVQHLLGTGHLRRAASIGSALAEAGHDVEIASGGPPLTDLDTGAARLVQLPAMRASDASFTSLVDTQGRPIDAGWKDRRREALLACFAALRPDVLITELFPFGRRQLEFELLPLLAAARAVTPSPLVLCSLRDVLVAPRDTTKIDRAIERAQTYDRVLVHGDPSLIDLPTSYPAAARISGRLSYTGYITSSPCPEPPQGDGEDEIIVSTGGGAVGTRVLEVALEARKRGENERRWRLLLGADLPAEVRTRLLARREPGLVIEPARRDFPALLRRCHVSVSQAGYNTAMDILQAKARAVLVPFAAGGETEQKLRATALTARGWAVTVEERDLSAATLAQAIARAGQSPRPNPGALRCTGASETARLIGDMLERRAA